MDGGFRKAEGGRKAASRPHRRLVACGRACTILVRVRNLAAARRRGAWHGCRSDVRDCLIRAGGKGASGEPRRNGELPILQFWVGKMPKSSLYHRHMASTC